MSEMVERAARAIWRLDMEGGADDADWPDIPPWQRDAYLASARAAIEAMREPTEAMTGNAKRLMDHPKFNHYDAAFVWRSMIDAALANGTETDVA